MIFSDQINHTLDFKSFPERIISLVPSQTELLYELGLDSRVVGITKFCIHPDKWFRTKQRVGGTKTLNLSKIEALGPDLIIANKEENTKEQIELLQKLYPVYTSDVSDLDKSLEMIKDIGEITNTIEKSEILLKEIKQQFQRFSVLDKKNYRTLYLIWKEPYMSVNQNTFINDMMKRCGFQNVISDNILYPAITENEIERLDPDLILLSSEPYPFREKHINELQECCPSSKVLLVDGEYFSWYGSRLMGSVDYFVDLMDKIS